jgi:hypothetical protein
MPKIFKARLIDRSLLPLNPPNKIIPAKPKACACPVPTKKVIVRDSGMARRTHLASFYGQEYSTLREVEDLKVFDNSNESQPPKLVCVFPGSGFVVENESDGVKIFLVSSEPVGVSTLGDKHTGMSAKRFQSEVILKARRAFAGGVR